MSGFKDVVGHKNIIQYIGNAVNSGMVSHAYILNGERDPVRNFWRIYLQ